VKARERDEVELIKVVRKSIEDVKEIVKGRVNEKGLRKSVR
jgi:hypothetical protein